MNSLYPATNEWIADHDDGGSLLADSSSGSVTFSSTKKGTPFNIRINKPSSVPSSMFFEVDIVEIDGSLGIGVVTEDKFQPGWKTKGMFYNGNLTNGSAGLTIGFGDRPKKGDKLGVYLVRSDTSLETIFYANGKCLGTGFRLDGPPNEAFYPCLHVSGSAVVNYTVPQEFPGTLNREASTDSDKYIGDWLLKQAFAGPELGEFPLPAGMQCILSFSSAGPSMYHLNIKLGNSLSTTVAITGKMENFDKIEINEIASTRMMPPPEIFQVESYMTESLPKLFKMIVSDRDLVMTGGTAEFICGPYEKEFEPLRSY